MKHKLFAFFLVLASLNLYAQKDSLTSNGNSSGNKVIRICAPSRSGLVANQPLYLLNGKVFSNQFDFGLINPQDIDSLSVSKDAKVMREIYGDKAKNGVIMVKLKPNVKLLTLNAIFKKYKISDKYLNLPVFVGDKRLITYQDFFMPDTSIESVDLVEKPDLLSGKERIIEIKIKNFKH